MKRFIGFIVLLLAVALGVSSVWGADQEKYKVKTGETLVVIAARHNTTPAEIKNLNPRLIKDINKINAGWVINVAPTIRKVSNVIPKVRFSGAVSKQQPRVKIASPYWVNTGANPYRGNLAEDISIFSFNPQNQEGLVQETSSGRSVLVRAQHISRGGLIIDEFGNQYRPMEMLSGGGKNVLELKTSPEGIINAWKDEMKEEAGWLFTFGGEFLVIYYKCKNPTLVVPVSKEPVISIVQEEPVEVIPSVPSIFKIEKTRDLWEHEFDIGGGIWQNKDHDAKGAWWYAQYKLFLRKYAAALAGGSVVPVVGLFARGDIGKTDSDYNWNNWGIGPQVGAMWNGITDSGYPQQVQVMFRTLYEQIHGRNDTSGYEKDERHFLLGYYAEYLRRFHPELMHVLYTEGWWDVAKSFNSTWSGDRASNRTRFSVGYKLHKDWNEEWASRFGVQFGYAPTHNLIGFNANMEMRYNDWLIFGPSLDKNLYSTIVEETNGFSYGMFARIELKHLVQESYSETMMSEVHPAEIDLFSGLPSNPLQE